MIRGNVEKAMVTHVCNLDPIQPGDFDICDKTMCNGERMPVNTALKAGDKFAIKVRINTNGEPLGAFDFRIAFDETILALDGKARVAGGTSCILGLMGTEATMATMA